MILDIRAQSRPPPSAFRSLPIFLFDVLMDTINQLAAVFHSHMYHCPTATPLKWPARPNALLAKSGQKRSVIAIWET
jgi:hypothetical protein